MNVWVVIILLFTIAGIYTFWTTPTVIKKRGGQGIAIITPSANTVRKIYNGKNKHRNKIAYYTHLYALNIMQGESHFPTLLSADPSTRTVVTNYCGNPINKRNLPRDWKKQLTAIRDIANKYHIDYIDCHAGNFTVKDGTIYLVDLGHFSQKCTTVPIKMRPFEGDRLIALVEAQIKN